MKNGMIDETTLMEAIKPPVTHESNLHNAIFIPAKLEFYFSHSDGINPAASAPYHRFLFDELFGK